MILKAILTLFVLSYCIGFSIAREKVINLRKLGHETSMSYAYNPIKWFSFILGYVVKRYDYILEQIIIRYNTEYCVTNCLNSPTGICIHCGCDAKAKMSSFLEVDSGGHWGKVIWDKDKYLKFREKYPITIKIEKEY